MVNKINSPRMKHIDYLKNQKDFIWVPFKEDYLPQSMVRSFLKKFTQGYVIRNL